MTTQLNGALIDGATSGLLTSATRITNLIVSTTAQLTGYLTIVGAGGSTFTTSAALNGVQAVGSDFFGPIYFALSNAGDVGKASVSWKPV